MGGGFAGQIIAQCAKRKGAYRVIVVDVLEGKLALARRLGANITLNPGQDNVIEAVKDLTNGLGADVVSVEPIAQDNPLLTSPNTLLTPHIAWATRTARQNITRIIAENIAGWMAGQPKSVVNKAYLNG